MPDLDSTDAKKKSKTFTGCFTCRSRKIRCDLRRPSCKNCKKAGLFCGGYKIKLRWLRPLRFRQGKTTPIQNPVVFEKETEKEADPALSEFFQRRHVGFVVWDEKKNCKPYETYEEMDDDLNALRTSHTSSATYMKGPFGVFKSAKLTPAPMHQLHQDPREATQSKLSTPGLLELGTQGHDHLWLSNELREHALLTAAALNGDPQFLDIDYQPLGIQSVNESLTDLLNLLFHRNTHAHNNTIPPTQDDNQRTYGPAEARDYEQTPTQENPIDKQVLENIAINPGNQHLFYSNFTNYFYNNPYQLNETLEIQLHASTTQLEDRNQAIHQEDINQGPQMPDTIMDIVRSPLQPKLGFDVSLPKHGVNLLTTALQVQPLTRYLLNYYVTQVADLMTVIPLTENPWKTIYFPRALMAIGELSALGKTSTAKNALLNALLAVSAFNLQSKFPKNSDQMKFYLNLGIRLRNQASAFIKTLLGSQNGAKTDVARCVASEKYKDILCAVMSMISVDLVWGTMQDTSFYIKWCERVIYTKMTNKKKLSAKAKILHRIFLSLKSIQDSTCLDLVSIKEDLDMTKQFGPEVRLRFGADLHDNTTKGRIHYIVDLSMVSSPMFVNKKLINTNKNDENFATDALYGLPNSLISLFRDTVLLLRRKIYHKEMYNALPVNFNEQSLVLNSRLERWRLDWKLYDDSNGAKTFYSLMHEATYHHIMSFYHALCIYYSRFIREVAPEKLQQKVATTLEHLNSIQGLIANDEAHIIPLFWQGFIAGCEATTLNLQMGFKKWGADIAQYLGSYWGARQIMLEVWRRKKSEEARDNWVYVIQDWEMNLMLN